MGLSSKQVYEDTFNWPQMGGLENLKAEAARGAETKNAAPMRCPRCDSTNTKFCYYNNYSRSQPRHFCRACRRHWTAGGTLRNVPVGGGRKNKRRKTTSDAAASSDPQPTRSAAAPFVGELDDAVLPDNFRQVLHQPGPPPASAFVDKSDVFGISLPPHSLPFMSEVGTLRSDFDFVFDSAALPFTAATSSSSCSTYSFGGHEGLLMDGSTASAWVQESPVLPAGFWDFYDGTTNFSGADLRQLAPQE